MDNFDSIIKEVLPVLRAGGTFLYPTDTVWGIGCDATNPEAVKKVFEIKKRDDAKSLVLLAANLDMVAKYVKEIPPIAVDLVEVNDRPMTIIYPKAEKSLAANAVAQDGSVAIRIPMMDFCQKLAYKLGRPVVSTSANISGEATPKCFADIPQEIRDAVDYIVDPALEQGSTGMASQILKVGMGGEIEIIRK